MTVGGGLIQYQNHGGLPRTWDPTSFQITLRRDHISRNSWSLYITAPLEDRNYISQPVRCFGPIFVYPLTGERFALYYSTTPRPSHLAPVFLNTERDTLVVPGVIACAESQPSGWVKHCHTFVQDKQGNPLSDSPLVAPSFSVLFFTVLALGKCPRISPPCRSMWFLSPSMVEITAIAALHQLPSI